MQYAYRRSRVTRHRWRARFDHRTTGTDERMNTGPQDPLGTIRAGDGCIAVRTYPTAPDAGDDLVWYIFDASGAPAVLPADVDELAEFAEKIHGWQIIYRPSVARVHSATFPSMPPVQPAAPEDSEGWPDVLLQHDDVILSFHEKPDIVLPGALIERHSVEVHPGASDEVNRVTLTLFACRVDVQDNHDDITVIHESRIRGTGAQR